MEKMFKRTLLGAAVALLSTSAMAQGDTYQVGINSDFDVDVYGVAAISAFYAEDSSGVDFENESRIGFRAAKAMTDNIEGFMQIESGYVGDSGADGRLGVRDTYLGLRGDWGSVRFGRMLTPLYEIVDWPYSNPGLGRVFDWGGDVKAHYDRKSDIARYDSPALGPVTFNISAGRGDTSVSGSNHVGAGLHIKAADFLTLHGGYETNSKYAGSAIDSSAYIVGFEASLPAGFGLAGAYKYSEGESKHEAYAGQEAEQGQYSIIAQYWNGPVGIKVGYAANLDSEISGVKQDDADDVISGQVMYVINGFVPYIRVGQTDAYNAAEKTYFARIGLEYGF